MVEENGAILSYAATAGEAEFERCELSACDGDEGVVECAARVVGDAGDHLDE